MLVMFILSVTAQIDLTDEMVWFLSGKTRSLAFRVVTDLVNQMLGCLLRSKGKPTGHCMLCEAVRRWRNEKGQLPLLFFQESLCPIHPQRVGETDRSKYHQDSLPVMHIFL